MKKLSNKSILVKAILAMLVGVAMTFQLEAAPQDKAPKAGKKSPDFSGYGLPFSALGSPKNVIVQVIENGDLTKSYSIRSRYENNSEEVSVEGEMTIPPLIARYDFVSVDTNGDVNYIETYTETPATESYLNYAAENAILDPISLDKTILNDTWSESWICNGDGAISTCNWTGNESGTPIQNNISAAVYTALGAGTVNGIAFNDLRGESNTYSSGIRYRVRAKGIGEVLRQQDGRRPRMAIYYQVDGATGGSLAGTPFASGAPLDGVLF